MRFNVCLVQPPGYIHSEALAEVGELLVLGLRDLGHAAALQRQGLDPDARNIILGCHLADPGLADRLPPGTIAINSEQIADPAAPGRATVLAWAQRAEIWDYSPRNIAVFAAAGVAARLLRLGYHPALHRIVPQAEPDIDVLFYGSLNERRRQVLAAVAGTGLHVGHVFGQYGAARDALIARSRLVLNLHFYDAQILEVVRLSYLMNNACAVVAEINPDTAADPDYAAGICGVPRDEIPAACRRLIDDGAARTALAAQALATLRRLPQAELLAPLLG
jgi:hypothetical protein